MEPIEFTLSEKEYDSLKGLNTENRAVQICKFYFLRQNKSAKFKENPTNGVDLEICIPRRPILMIEVKGTKASGIAKYQLGVSSIHSFRKLSKGMPLYRVANVNRRNVSIWILKYPNDFKMTPQKRWGITIY